MNDSEKLIREKYEEQGYDAIHVGVPDFILLKDGNIEFVEVKKGTSGLNEAQKRAIALLRHHGFNTRVERVPVVHHSPLLEEWEQRQTRPDHSSPGQATPVQTIPNQSSPTQPIPARTKQKGGEIDS